MRYLLALAALLGGASVALAGLRWWDLRADRAEWVRLAGMQPADPPRFDAAMVAALPEPARRYFAFAILPGTPLYTVAEIAMGGEFSLGSRDDPRYQPMEARQILAAPAGFVWTLRLPGMLSGSDYGALGGSWTRFRAFALVPVARMGGDVDHRRAAFGRYIAEAVFWTPAALLPGPGVRWDSLGTDRARVTVTAAGLAQAVDVTVDSTGRPVDVQFMRWSNANAEQQYRLQPFGGVLSDFREVQGFRLPHRVEAGNMFGTDAYFAFYKAVVTRIEFPTGGQR